MNDKKYKIVDDFDKDLKEALRICAKEFKENHESPTAPPVEFSPDFENWKKDYLERVRDFEYQRIKMIKRIRLKKYLKRIAIGVAAFITVAGITVFGVEALRIQVMNFFIELTDSYTKIDFTNEKADNPAESGDIKLDYIPEGFALCESEMEDNKVFLKFKKDTKYFNILRRDAHSVLSIDSENAEIVKIDINGKEAYYSTNENINILVFHDNTYSYELSGNIEKEEIIGIAQNIKMPE